MMKIKGLRWGCSGGGITCGPVEGAANIEVTVQDSKGILYFVLVNRFMDFYRIMVSPFSLFDSYTLVDSDGLDVEHLCSSTEAVSTEWYDFEEENCPESLMRSEYLDIFRFAFRALDTIDAGVETSEKNAEQFLSKYLDGAEDGHETFPFLWE